MTYTVSKHDVKQYSAENCVSFVVISDCDSGSVNYISVCELLLQNPDYMQEKFVIKIETLHLPDRGTTENVCYVFILCCKMFTVCVCDKQYRYYIIASLFLFTSQPGHMSLEGKHHLLTDEIKLEMLCRLSSAEIEWFDVVGLTKVPQWL